MWNNACFLTPLPVRLPLLPPSSYHRGHTQFHRQQPKLTATSTNENSSLETRRAIRREQKRTTSLNSIKTIDFNQHVQKTTGNPGLFRRHPKTLQVNIGLTCNLACHHCHVGSSPSRKETMSRYVRERLIELLRRDIKNGGSINTVDITGGAPELHKEFKPLIKGCKQLGIKHIIDRCNLTVLIDNNSNNNNNNNNNNNGHINYDLIQWLANNQVKIIASLPCYTVENVEAQRGHGVFDSSIQALIALNQIGYGKCDNEKGLILDLVYNPVGAFLPGSQKQLEVDYKRELKRVFNIDFNHLICITNMPIQRFADDLRRKGELQEYMDLLVGAYNPSTVDRVMCLDMVHVAYDGRIYDCDFNYALGMNLTNVFSKGNGRGSVIPGAREGLNVFDIESFEELENRRIRTGPHCFGCTAGSGSSCGGQVAK